MNEFTFPQGFLWGAATSAHQVEGENVHSDWWAWEHAGKVKEPSGRACEHYQRFASDFDLAASLGHTMHRFSIEWSRIEPAEGQWNDEALAHYGEVLRALRQRGLEPLVTLHHFTNPQWVLDRGGWTNPKTVDRFARYTQRVAEALGEHVRYWITINEPMVYVRMHYVDGFGPPGARDAKASLAVIEHLLRAHAVGYHVLHHLSESQQPPVQVSLAQYVPDFWPCHPWWMMDRWAASFAGRMFNDAVIEALTEGRWQVPTIGTWELPEARGTLDFLGVNFYGRQFLRWTPWIDGWPITTCDLGRHPRQVTERTSMGWDVSPESFHRTLLSLRRWNLPVLVTENGTYMTDDAQRWRFILRHIQAMARAMQVGVPVLGYCYWSLLDNFEWAEGFGPRFGLIEVDYPTQQRRIRDSARRYADICRANRVPLE